MTTTRTDATDAWTRAVTTILAAQRDAVLQVLDGLDEHALRTPVLPSGWTPIGLVEHLTRAETLWFQHVVAGGPTERHWAEGPEPEPYVTDTPTGDVLAHYRRAGELADGLLAGVAPDDPPRGWVPPELEPFATDVATVCVHMIEETARHLGHLDVARELIDGRTGLGPR